MDAGGIEQVTFGLPVGTVTLMLTDVEGSTRLWESLPEAMSVAVARHYELLDAAIGLHGGVRPLEQGEGDSVVAAFARASDAVAAALDVQRAFHGEGWPAGVSLRLRIALHTAEAQLRDKDNYFGRAVNRCARLHMVVRWWCLGRRVIWCWTCCLSSLSSLIWVCIGCVIWGGLSTSSGWCIRICPAGSLRCVRWTRCPTICLLS